MAVEVFDAVAPIAQSHIVPLRSSGAGLPLFCFPGSGGSVHVFREMVAALPEGHPVYGIDMEWLCDTRKDFTVEEIAVFYLKIIRKVQKTGPYYFCGYSFGSLVAYEMARRLTDEGDGAGLVALLDASNPAMMANLSRKQSAQFRRRYLLDRLGKYARNLLRGDIRAFADRGSAFISSRTKRIFVPAIKFGFQLLNKPQPIIVRANDPGFLRAWHAFVPSSYPKHVVCFRVEDRGSEHDIDPTMGWNACATGGVQVHVVPGGHLDMMRIPTVRVIAEKLAVYLNSGTHSES
jgi:thioesterase domain-containing protein